MSIASAIYAEYAEKVRKDWLRQLREAYEKQNWLLVHELIVKIDAFRFSE